MKNISFASTVAPMLEQKSVTQADITRSANVTPAYVNHLVTGRKNPSPEWVDIIADSLKASPKERQRLHRAAAISAGFKLTL